MAYCQPAKCTHTWRWAVTDACSTVEVCSWYFAVQWTCACSTVLYWYCAGAVWYSAITFYWPLLYIWLSILPRTLISRCTCTRTWVLLKVHSCTGWVAATAAFGTVTCTCHRMHTFSKQLTEECFNTRRFDVASGLLVLPKCTEVKQTHDTHSKTQYLRRDLFEIIITVPKVQKVHVKLGTTTCILYSAKFSRGTTVKYTLNNA